jgi:HEXXH motif-containing protein
MSVVSAADARAQITAFEIDPDATRLLARAYYRRFAERLDRGDGSPGGHAHSVAEIDIEWLHPRLVWAARGGTGLTLDSFAAEIGAGGERGGPPPLEHFPCAGHDPWVIESVDMLDKGIREVHSDHHLALSERLATRSRDTVDAAAEVLGRVWPEAAEEFRTLVRAIVYVEGDGFGSATIPKAFGAVYTSEEYVGSTPAAFEMLLHETGHHSLYLRNSFARFVVNGADMAGHPLRADPRPVSGVVHSAHALARMATGLTRWANEPDAPDEVLHRRDVAVRDLSDALDTLAGKAEWTPAGEKYFTALRACEKALQPEWQLRDGPGGQPVSVQKNRPLSANRR